MEVSAREARLFVQLFRQQGGGDRAKVLRGQQACRCNGTHGESPSCGPVQGISESASQNLRMGVLLSFLVSRSPPFPQGAVTIAKAIDIGQGQNVLFNVR